MNFHKIPPSSGQKTYAYEYVNNTTICTLLQCFPHEKRFLRKTIKRESIAPVTTSHAAQAAYFITSASEAMHAVISSSTQTFQEVSPSIDSYRIVCVLDFIAPQAPAGTKIARFLWRSAL
ncbi:MAG: hypothetical protein GX291_00835 [Tissierellia bacterium]|jgi:hypothetical protein|nr:hypothetical protein [Bacillota bacterium]NLK57797.1 hypothetical protein [Tissierellia bacterium]